MAHIQLTVQPRTEFGTSVTRRLRREGLVPGVLYQKGSASLAFATGERELRKLIQADGSRTAVIDLAIGADPARPALLREWQVDPVRGALLHVDLAEVDLTHTVQASVALVLVGTPAGVREGGVLDQTMHEVLVEALPDSLPEHIELDVSTLEIGGSVHLGDVATPTGTTILGDLETVVASVTAPSSVEVEEVEEDVEPELVGEKEPGEE